LIWDRKWTRDRVRRMARQRIEGCRDCALWYRRMKGRENGWSYIYKHAVSILPIIALLQQPSSLVELLVLHFAR
jgi:hypothetical protein